MGRRRKKYTGLPPGVRCRNGYYSYRSPVDGAEYGLGRDRAVAITHARHAGVSLAERASGAALLTAEDILGRAVSRSETMCGIYVLIHESRIMYVGKSTNLHRRLAMHAHKALIPFDSYHLIPCDASKLDLTEAAYIAALKPRRNRQLQLSSLQERAETTVY